MSFDVNAEDLPAIRIASAVGRGVNKNILFKVGGGLGDRVCAEPTLRYALENFKDVKISLACDTPEIYRHLKFEEVFDFKTKKPLKDDFLILETYPTSQLFNQFFNPNLVNSVDFASISALRCQIPRPHDRRIILHPIPSCNDTARRAAFDQKYVAIHPGKTWESRTFPADWWNTVIQAVRHKKRIPLLVGNNTVEVNPTDCVDLRDRLSLNDFAWVCMNVHAIVTNDSSPLHLGAAGSTTLIAHISTARHPDLLRHWRRGVLGWGMKNFALGGHWERVQCPNDLSPNRIAEADEKQIRSWLPAPSDIMSWIEMGGA